MATHNQVRLVGFLLGEPKILNRDMEGAEKAIFKIRTVHRKVDGFSGMRFQDVLIFYDGTEFMEHIKKLTNFDMVDITGVINIMTVNKRTLCDECGHENIKYSGTTTYIYPLSLKKLNALKEAYEHDNELPEKILIKHYLEVSNRVFIIGTVVSEPEMIGTEKQPCCRYRLGVDRKYYIPTQGDITADYPWVYSYGQQAEYDYAHLKKAGDGDKGTLVLVDGFVQFRSVEVPMPCEYCGITYKYKDVMTEFVPYAVEYLNNYLTDEEIAEKEAFETRMRLAQATTGI